MTRATSHLLFLDASPLTSSLEQALVTALGPINWIKSLKELTSELRGKGPGEWPRLILSEIDLPDGSVLDWITDWKNLQSTLPAPWVAVTRRMETDAVTSCLRAGMRDAFTLSSLGPIEIAKIIYYAHSPLAVASDLSRAILEKEVRLDPYTRTVSCSGGASAQLTPMEFKILANIHQAFPAGLDRHRLFQILWGERKVVPKALDVHIFNLRRKLEEFRYQVRSTPNGEFCLLRKVSTAFEGRHAHESNG